MICWYLESIFRILTHTSMFSDKNILSSVSRQKTKHVLKGKFVNLTVIYRPPYAPLQKIKPCTKFLQGTETLSHPKRHSKALNLIIKELF